MPLNNKGSFHLQGICSFNAARSTGVRGLRGLCEVLSGGEEDLARRTHCEPMLGSWEQARDYCCKDTDGTFDYERGEEPARPGQRIDLKRLAERVKAGESDRDLAEFDPVGWMRSHRMLGAYRAVLQRRRDPADDPPRCFWFYGASGAGKTRTAIELAGTRRVYITTPPRRDGSGIWWGGYEQQPVVIIDDFRYGDISFNQLLRLLDRYPVTVEAKGLQMEFYSDIIVVTTILHWNVLFQNGEDLFQIERRLTRTVEIGVDEINSFD